MVRATNKNVGLGSIFFERMTDLIEKKHTAWIKLVDPSAVENKTETTGSQPQVKTETVI